MSAIKALSLCKHKREASRYQERGRKRWVSARDEFHFVMILHLPLAFSPQIKLTISQLLD